MRVLVFEFIVGGGVADQHPLNSELQTFYLQGHSMLKVVCEDLLELGHEVIVTVDQRAEETLPNDVIRINIEHESHLDLKLWNAAIQSDAILLIAPETDGCLEYFANSLSSFHTRFISPSTGFIQLASDKWKCHQWYSQRSVPCPESLLLTDSGDLKSLPLDFFPCVVKPVDGAGSEGVRMISSMNEFENPTKPMLLQRFISGVPASVSVIVESADMAHFLEPGRQVFDAEPFGVHLRTEFPLDPDLRQRALKLAKNVVDASPNLIGYVGIDMVLADDPCDDVMIEINPRLTTSYCFLREWSKENLAEKFPFE